MTAYGRSLRITSLGKWLIEIHSVNKKTFDLNVFMPKDLMQFDLEVRKLVSIPLKRGQVTVKIFLYPDEASFDLAAQTPYLKSMKEEMKKACLSIGCSTADISFPFLYEQVKSVSFGLFKEESLVREDLCKGIEEALLGFVKMKEAEGKSLAEAFQKHLSVLKQLLVQIETRLVGSEDRRTKKILDKLKDFKEITEEDKDRVLREVFFYAEKADVAEEITRMHSHIDQFYQILVSEEPSVGRTMDFLIQEMGREANTLSSKADDLEVSYAALKMKSEIEKIREQAQNVE